MSRSPQNSRRRHAGRADQARAAREDVLSQSREVRRAAVQESPVRAFAVSAAQFAASRFGGQAGIRERASRAAAADAKAVATWTKLADAEAALSLQEERRGKIQDKGSKAYKKQTAEIEAQGLQIGSLKKVYEDQAAEAVKLNNSVASGADILRNFGAITVGVVTGQVAFKAIMAGAQAAMGAFSNAVSPAIERTLGFQNASNALVKTIAEQTRALSGQEKVAVAQTVAQSGLSDAAYASIRPFLEQRAAVEANNKAYQEQNVLLAAGRNIQFQNARFQTNAGTKTAAGLPEGVSPGLFQATGGANVLGVQTPFGSQAPFEEGLRERLAQIPDFTSAFTGGGVHFGPATLFQPPEYQGVSLEDRLSNREKTLTSVLGDLQDDFKNTGIEWVRSTDAMAASTDDATKYLKAAGIQLTPGQLAEQGVSVSQATLGLSPADFQLGLQQASQQAATPSTDALLAAAEPQLKALRFGIDNNLKNQLEIYLPAQRAIQRAAQPIQPLTAGLLEKPRNGHGSWGERALRRCAASSYGQFRSLPERGAARDRCGQRKGRRGRASPDRDTWRSAVDAGWPEEPREPDRRAHDSTA